MIKLLAHILLFSLVVGWTESPAFAQVKGKAKKSKSPAIVVTPNLNSNPVPAADSPAGVPPNVVPTIDEGVPSESVGTEAGVPGGNLVTVGFAYLKTLGPVKEYAANGWQYGMEWNRRFESATQGWQPYAGLIYHRAKLKGTVGANDESKVTHTRTDYLVVCGYNSGGSGPRFYGDGQLGVISRRLYIESGTPGISDDFYSKTSLGLGFRSGLEFPKKIDEYMLISRVALGMMTGVKMPSGRLRYNQDTVDINGAHLTLGADLGWFF